MDQQTLSLLIKVGEQKHIEALYKRGEVFMNYLRFFKEDTKNKERKDISEGASQIDQVNWLKISSKEISLEMARHGLPNKITSALVREYDPNRSGNIYSMMGLDPLFIEQVGQIDEKNMDFGDTALLILKPGEFLKRLESAIHNSGLKSFYDKVTYYDEKEYSGPLDVFHKPLTYAHQLEFRFFIPSLENKPLKFNVGSLEGIAQMIPAQDLLKKKI